VAQLENVDRVLQEELTQLIAPTPWQYICLRCFFLQDKCDIFDETVPQKPVLISYVSMKQIPVCVTRVYNME
jgi:hypothetical protein